MDVFVRERLPPEENGVRGRPEVGAQVGCGMARARDGNRDSVFGPSVKLQAVERHNVRASGDPRPGRPEVACDRGRCADAKIEPKDAVSVSGGDGIGVKMVQRRVRKALTDREVAVAAEYRMHVQERSKIVADDDEVEALRHIDGKRANGAWGIAPRKPKVEPPLERSAAVRARV
jgi:hypothetical protein